MAAFDEFDRFNNSLSEKERETLSVYMRTLREDLLAARSEDARLRQVGEYIAEVHRRLRARRA